MKERAWGWVVCGEVEETEHLVPAGWPMSYDQGKREGGKEGP